MITTQFPFLGKSKKELFHNVKVGVYKNMDYFSENLKDLLSKMLDTDPHKRYSIRDCLAHPFIKSELGTNVP
jgi:serine/threonine protein kinase